MRAAVPIGAAGRTKARSRRMVDSLVMCAFRLRPVAQALFSRHDTWCEQMKNEHGQAAAEDSMAQHLLAIARSEAIFRMMKGRSTAVDEAVRFGVSVDTISAWLDRAFEAVRCVLDDGHPADRSIGTPRDLH